MAVSKVIFGSETLVDLTNDTIKAEVLVEGYTAHDASGNQITGTMKKEKETWELTLEDGTIVEKVVYVG